MSGVAVETMLELWASELRGAKARMRPLFTQVRVATSAGLFLDGLLGPERRKTGWMRAEAAGDPGPWRQQAILGRGRWEADALRDVVRDYALEALATHGALRGAALAGARILRCNPWHPGGYDPVPLPRAEAAVARRPGQQG